MKNYDEKDKIIVGFVIALLMGIVLHNMFLGFLFAVVIGIFWKNKE